MKKQNKQFLIKKIILSTIIFSGVFLVIFNINFSFSKTYYIYINKVFAGDVQAGGKPSRPQSQQTDVSSESGGTKLNNLGELVVYGLLKTIAILISATVHLINFSLSEEFVNNLFNSKAIYTGWKMVRDTLNIMFIFFLLFSAFSTIFQVSKYHIKSTWVMIVVMALLVNFSWPITRVIIDFSNVTMDYILGSPGTGTSTGEVASAGLMGKLSNNAKFFEIMIGKDYFVKGTNNKINLDKEGVLSAMMIGIIIGAIFLFTIGAIALLLLIRVILMAVLLVFASAGFVFAAFPSTSSVSSKWWKALLDQAILGPVVLFSLMLAVGVMGEVNDSVSQTHTMISGQLKALPQYAVSIILIWTGILAAKSISGQTAGMALNGATRVKGFAWKSTKFGAKVGDGWMARGVNRAIKSDNKFVGGLGRGAARLRAVPDRAKNIYQSGKKKNEDALALTKAHGLNDSRAGGDKSAIAKYKDKKVAEEIKKLKESGASLKTMMAEVSGAKGAKRDALIHTISNHKDFGKGEDKDYDKLIKMMLKLDKGQRGAIEGKLKENGKGHLVVQNLAKELQANAKKEGKTMSNSVAMKKASVKVIGGMDAKTLAKQEVWKNKGKGNFIMRRIAEDRIKDYSPRQQQDFAGMMSMEMKMERMKGQEKMKSVGSST